MARRETPDIMGDLLNGTVAKPKPHFDLTVPDNLTFDEWMEFGGRVGVAEANMRFFVGDWLLAYRGEWGSMYGDAMEATGFTYDYLAKCHRVAKAFEFGSRDLNLSWSHHLAALSAGGNRYTVIEGAAASGASVADTRASARGTCKRCHRPLTAGQSVVNGMGPCCAAKAARAASIEDAKDDNLGPGETFSVWVERDYEDQIADLDNFLGRNFPDFTDGDGDTVTIAIDVMRWMMNEINREDGTR